MDTPRPIDHVSRTHLVLIPLLLGVALLGLGACDRSGMEPVALTPDQRNGPVRLAYQLDDESGWHGVETLTLRLGRIEVDFVESERGCDDSAYLAGIENRTRAKPSGPEMSVPPVATNAPGSPVELAAPGVEPEPRVYFRDLRGRPLILGPAQPHRLLVLPELDALPSGFIVGLRLFIEEADLDRDGDHLSVEVEVPKVYRTRGLRLAAREGRIPRCAGDITAVRFDLDGEEWLAGAADAPILLALAADRPAPQPHLLGETMAPIALFPSRGGRLEVPAVDRLVSALWVDIPSQAVAMPRVIRVREMDLEDRPEREIGKGVGVQQGAHPPDPLYVPAEDAGPYRSADPIFRGLMGRFGLAYDLRPDGQHFARPVSIALPAPVPRIPLSGLDQLPRDGLPLPLKLYTGIAALNDEGIDDLATFRSRIEDRVDRVLGPEHPFRAALIERLGKLVQGVDHPGESLALYTWSPAYRLWLPDVPRLTSTHRERIAEAIADAETLRAEANPGTEIEPDFSAIPAGAYDGVRVDYVNNRIEHGFLITDTNHFCTKTLFADLNVARSGEGSYPPLLDGALDDMCQTTDGIGFERDSNERVHCGGDPADSSDQWAAEQDVGDIILAEGVSLGYRDNVFDFFDALPDCPAAPTNADYCYDLEDFQADVEWAIEVWREAINRNPDGSWTERFFINDDDSEPRIDVRIRDIRKSGVAAWAWSRNFTVDEPSVLDATRGPDGRLELRGLMLHELGHNLGLHHWVSPGTLMSYNGRWRRNDHAQSLCCPLTASQIRFLDARPPGSPPLRDYCLVPALAREWITHFGRGTLTDAAGNPYNARMNALSCTDVQRIRRRIHDADLEWTDDWTRPLPLRCELLTARSDYAAVERSRYDDSDSAHPTISFGMELDLPLPHCGLSAQFDRAEVVLLGVDPDNTGNVVTNLYRPGGNVYSIDLDPRGADGYRLTLSLDSSQLLETRLFLESNGVTRYPSFTRYRDGENGLDGGMSWPHLALVLRTFVDTTEGGLASEYLAGSTGLLRTPLLTPVEAPIRLSLQGLFLQERDDPSNAEDIGSSLLLSRYDDVITAPDQFPLIGDSTRKPSVGQVTYLVLPPRAASDTREVRAAMQWDLHQAPTQFRSWDGEAVLLWIDSLRITRENVPTVASPGWIAGGVVGTPQTLVDLSYPSQPGVTLDPCLHRSGAFELAGAVPTEALRVLGTQEVWDLYHLQFGYAYLRAEGCADPRNACSGPGGSLDPSCTLSPVVQPAPAPSVANRSQDFYLSLSGPNGGIVTPARNTCVFDTQGDEPWGYEVAANVDALRRLPAYFEGLELQVKIQGEGNRVNIRPYRCFSSDWHDISSLRVGQPFSYNREHWYESADGDGYEVTLRYRYRGLEASEAGSDDAQASDCNPDEADAEAGWSAPVILDRVRVFIDDQNDGGDCPSGFVRERHSL